MHFCCSYCTAWVIDVTKQEASHISLAVLLKCWYSLTWQYTPELPEEEKEVFKSSQYKVGQ